MNKRLIVVSLIVMLAASFAAALEVRVEVKQRPVGCDPGKWVRVNPAYSGTDKCVVAAVPADAFHIVWWPTELWEKPAQNPQWWTRLTCGAWWDASANGWSYSCWDGQEIGMEGLFRGPGEQLNQAVTAWWMTRR